MITPDADLLVHVITRDDPQRLKVAAAALRSDQIFILKTVLMELAWRLSEIYDLTQDQLCTALETLIGLENATIEDEQSVELALIYCREGLKFTDALNLAQSRTTARYVTFDKALTEKVTANPDFPRVRLLVPPPMVLKRPKREE